MVGLFCGMFFSYLAAYILTYLENDKINKKKDKITVYVEEEGKEEEKEGYADGDVIAKSMVDNSLKFSFSLLEITLFACITMAFFIVLVFYNTGIVFHTQTQYFVFGFLFLSGGILPIVYRSYALFKLYRKQENLFLTNFIIIIFMIFTLFCNMSLFLTDTFYHREESNVEKVEWVDTEYNRIVEELNSDGFNKDIIAEAIQYNHNVQLVQELDRYDCDISDEMLERYMNGKEIDINGCIGYYVEKNLNMTLKADNKVYDITEPTK